MELNEERRKKLEAGKEKLAAFRKKKAKGKKAEPEKQTASKEIIEPLNGGNPSPPEYNDVLSSQEDSDQFFISSGDEFSSETQATDNLNFYQKESIDLTYSDLEKALVQRDALIAQLTESLQTNTNEPPQESDMLAQIQALSQHVALLQNQLLETAQAVQEQTMLRDVSSTALQMAKGQMLQLQTIVHDKDDDLQSAYKQLESTQSCLKDLESERDDLINDLAQRSQEINSLTKTLEDLDHLENVQKQWHEREQVLQDKLASKSEEINRFRESDQHNKVVYDKMSDENKKKDERLLVLQEELEALKKIKADLEIESQGLREENKELAEYRQNASTSLLDHNLLTAEFDKLIQAHTALSTEHESLKSKCLFLENVVDKLKEEKSSSKSQLDDLKNELEGEHKRHQKEEEAWLAMESRQNASCDQLNNKLNDLQNKLSTSEEALDISEKALSEERQVMANVQSHLNEQLTQHSELLSQVQSKDEKIAELEKLQLDYDDMAQKLQGKESDLMKSQTELLEKLSESEKQLEELKSENKILTEQTVKLKDDLLTAQHVHGVEMSERDYRENNIEEQMELMNEELNSAVKRSTELENKVKEKESDLVAEVEKREAFENQLKALKSERDTLRETVQSLNVDIGHLKEELTVEPKAPVEEKIMAYENQQLNATLKKSEKETEEKVQLAILEEEILTLKTKLDEKESTSQNLEDKLHRCQSEYSEILEANKSDILHLEQDLESQSSQNDKLCKELTELKSTLDKAKDNLLALKESHNAAKEDLKRMRNENLELKAINQETVARINELESDASTLQSACQARQERETDLLRTQDALKAQMETAVSDCQKLQQSVEEKDAQLQNLQENLDEERKNWSSSEEAYGNDLSTLKANADEWKQKYDESEVAIKELKSHLSDAKDDLDSKEVELSAALAALNDKDLAMRDLEEKLFGKDTEMGSIAKEIVKSKEEMSQLLSKLERSQQDMETALVEIEDIRTTLNSERQEKETVLEKLHSNEKELLHLRQLKEEIGIQSQDLQTQLESKQSHITNLTTNLEDLNILVADLELKCAESNDLLCKELKENSVLCQSINKLKVQGLRQEAVTTSLSEDLQEKESTLIMQNTLLLDTNAKLEHLNEISNEKNEAMKILEESNVNLSTEKEKLETFSQALSDENQHLQAQVKKLEDSALVHEQDVIQLSIETKQFQEETKQAKQEVEDKKRMIHDLTNDNEIQKKEIMDLKSDIEDKDCKIEGLGSELDVLQASLHTSNEEKKLLKTNFDACMEDMQQKITDQETEMRQLKSQLAEESRNISQGQTEMKELFEVQLSQVEDKLLEAEKEKRKLENEIAEAHETANELKESYENQLSELELSLQAANSECVRLNESLVKANTNFENEIMDLKSLHEMQRSELLDNNISLEKTIDELQKTLTEQTDQVKAEREELEQSFEAQMLDLDEKRRFNESEAARLKRFLDEMRKDNEKDMQGLEKRYETQLFELEDKCSIMGAELERARKSMMSVEGDFVEERKTLELKVEDLENIRREFEIKISVLDDDLSNLKGLSQRREEEMKFILQNAAERQTTMVNEIGCLTEELSRLKAEKESSLSSLSKKYESAIEDLETRNKHLEAKVTSLEMHVEEDTVLRKQEPSADPEDSSKSKIVELKEQIGVLSNENLSLKRRLLSHKSSEKKNLLSTGVEDICPSLPHESVVHAKSLPKLMTSTPAKGFDSEDSFSPTEEEVSMIAGFVAESDQPPFIRNIQSFEEDREGEPDFVAEEQNRFQPEIVNEKVIESLGHATPRLNMHPILEKDITDEFQPEEFRDQFLIEEPIGVWPLDLSVGKSPTMQDHQQFHFNDIPIQETPVVKSSDPECLQALPLQTADWNTNHCVEEEHPLEPQKEEESKIPVAEMECKLADLRERLEEEYVTEMRNQKRDLLLEYETKQEDYQREMELHYMQKVQSINNDWQSKFPKAIQKLRKVIERHHSRELRMVRQRRSPKSNAEDNKEEQRKTNEEGMPDIAEGSEELDERVEQLSRENKELAEVRDELLKQLEITQTWGLHHRLQHELQSKISGRESPVPPQSSSQTPSNESPTIEESPIISATHTLTNTSPVHEKASMVVPMQVEPTFSPAHEESIESIDSKILGGASSENVSSESGSLQTEMNETSSGGERFLEEFTDISQQSSQDLPLEWELTMTLADAGEFAQNPQHGSVWEVFDGRCLRQDCQEVRQLYRRLFRFLVKCNIDGNDWFSEESGLLPPLNVDNSDRNSSSDGFFLSAGSSLSDVQNYANEEAQSSAGAFALNTILRLEKEQLGEELSFEHLKIDLYETLEENENLRLILAEECNVRRQIEKKYKTEMKIDKDKNRKKEKEVASLSKSRDEIVEVDRPNNNSMSFDHRSADNRDVHNSECKSDSCKHIIQSLKLALLDKEHTLIQREDELASLKSLKNDSSELEVPIRRLRILTDEVESLKKEVEFKNRVIKNLREDLNKLIYPKPSPLDKAASGPSEDLSGLGEKGSIVDVLNHSFTHISQDSHSIGISGELGNTSTSSCPSHGGHDDTKISNKELISSTPKEEEIVKSANLAMTSHQDSAQGFEAEIAEGESLALVSQQEVDDITSRQPERLTQGDGDGLGSLILDDTNLMMQETLNVNILEGSLESSSSSITLPSQLNTSGISNDQDTPPTSELQDRVLANELNELRRDLRETRVIYSQENSLLHEALQRDKLAKDLIGGRKKDSFAPKSDTSQSQDKKGKMLTEDEFVTLTQRLTICLEQNRMLEEENTSLRARIREQDAVVLIVKQKLFEKEQASDEWRKSMNHQLQCLQEQRDDLLKLLRNLEDGKGASVSEAMGEAALKEESLRQAQEDLMEKMEELDHLHQMLTQRQIELQHCEAERQHLEQLCLLKDQTEMQLMKQKRLMEEQVSEIELCLRERETHLVDEKTRLLRELREKDQQLSQVSQSARNSPTPPSEFFKVRSSSLGDLNTGLVETLNTSRRHDPLHAQADSSSIDNVDKQHMEAILKLKQKLKLEYDLRAARMAESQASAIASYWERHGKSS